MAMHWTTANVLIIAAGLAVVGASVLLFRFRVTANQFFLDRQTSTFGQKVGERMRRGNSPTRAVGIPAIWGMLLGALVILGGIFGHPH